MSCVSDKQVLKPGLVIFRRGDVQHDNWYCRVKLPKADRYKTVSLKTNDINIARDLAYDQDGEVRYALKHDVPVFNRPFRDVGKEYLTTQIARAKRGEISKGRPDKMKAVIEGPLCDYVGSTQVHRIGDELWGSYPAWRRENGEGRAERNGGRRVSRELAVKFVTREQAMMQKARAAKGLRLKPLSPAEFEAAVAERLSRSVPFISDETISFEMSIFGAVMQFAIKKRYVPASQRFDDRPKLKTMRRDEFTEEEYTRLYRYARDVWAKGKTERDIERGTKLNPISAWYRAVAYNFVLIMCNTGMRPSEARNLRWRDVTTAKDQDGREIVVLFVQGKGKSRKLVAVPSVGKYLGRVQALSKATTPDDPVFTTIDGTSANSLYQALIEDLLQQSNLQKGPGGTMRSTYSFRHTYATHRLSQGVDVYLLAEQMGTSVKMIEDHYGHVNTIKHADRVLRGAGGWHGLMEDGPAETDAKAAKVAAARDKAARPAPVSRSRASGQRPGPR